MIPEKNLKISFDELSLRGKKILEQQPPVTYEQAFAQVQRLKKNSKVNQSSKKGRSDS